MLDLIKRGSIAGLFAGISVAVGVLFYDLFHLEPLATPDALARNVMGGPIITTSSLGAVVWMGPFFERAYGLVAYSAVHLSIFALVGIAGAWLFRAGKAPANVLTGMLFGMIAGTGVFYAGYGVFAPTFVDAPAWQLILAMNAVAGVVMVALLVDEPEVAA